MTAPCLPGLFDAGPAPMPHKRQRVTARESYRRIVADETQRSERGTETREAQVLRCLKRYQALMGQPPSALELLRFMELDGEPVFDANSVRPRITALVDQGLVVRGEKARCSISGQTVWTWLAR